MVAEEYDLFDLNPYLEEKKESDMISDLAEYKSDLCNDITIENLPANLDELELQIDRLKQRWSEFTYLIGQRLKFINDKRLFEEKGYTDFQTYANIALKMSENNAYYYISIFEFFTEEQTVRAGSKLKLIIPILNKIKRDREIPDEIKIEKIKDLRDDLFLKIYNKTYREAEKIIQEIKFKHFNGIEKIIEFEKIQVKDDRIIIHESDIETREKLLKIINKFYK